MPRHVDAPNAGAATAVVYLGLGANLGNPRVAIASAVDALSALEAMRVARSSSLYRSAPVGADGPDYVNAVVELHTALGPLELLAELQRIESAHKRVRPHRNAPRTLDIDILVYADLQLETTVLTLPHPRLHQRAFVLIPLAEIAPELIIPGHGSVTGLLPAIAAQRIDKL